MNALTELGTLYRDSQGHEVWRIVDREDQTIADGVESDHDAAWIAGQV